MSSICLSSCLFCAWNSALWWLSQPCSIGLGITWYLTKRYMTRDTDNIAIQRFWNILYIVRQSFWRSITVYV
jgi:hypothetical protein